MRTSPLESELAQEAVWNISLEGKCQEVTRLAERKVGGGGGELKVLLSGRTWMLSPTWRTLGRAVSSWPGQHAQAVDCPFFQIDLQQHTVFS